MAITLIRKTGVEVKLTREQIDEAIIAYVREKYAFQFGPQRKVDLLNHMGASSEFISGCVITEVQTDSTEFSDKRAMIHLTNGQNFIDLRGVSRTAHAG